jgi:hypothetical protein
MGAREEIISALFAALGRIDGIALCERNRVHPIDDNTPAAIVLHDGDIVGETDRKFAIPAGRTPVSPQTLTPTIWGYVEGSSETIGTKVNELYEKVVAALFGDVEFLRVLASHDGGVGIDGAAFPAPSKATSPAIGVFMLEVSLPFTFAPFH